MNDNWGGDEDATVIVEKQCHEETEQIYIPVEKNS